MKRAAERAVERVERGKRRSKAKEQLQERKDFEDGKPYVPIYDMGRALPTYFLFESTYGFSLLLAPHGLTEVGDKDYKGAEELVKRFDDFFEVVCFQPFESDDEALIQYKAVLEGIVTNELMNFLECYLPKPANEGGRPCYVLAVSDPFMQNPIILKTKVSTACTHFHSNIMRVFRTNIGKIIPNMKPGDLGKAQRKMACKYNSEETNVQV